MLKTNYIQTRFLIVALSLLTTVLWAQKENSNQAIQQEILNHGLMIREAFKEGDIAKIASLHHPDVNKALGYNDLKKGREEVLQGIETTLQLYSLEFIENTIENILVRDAIAIEQTRFAIKGTPKEEGEPFLFRGRTMVTYMRYDQSPSGWATIREIIQPFND